MDLLLTVALAFVMVFFCGIIFGYVLAKKDDREQITEIMDNAECRLPTRYSFILKCLKEKIDDDLKWFV